MSSRVIAELVGHLGRVASGDGGDTALTPVQWAALRYFAHANRFSRTPSAFAAFQGTTRGTASQTIKSLVAQGYLEPIRSQTDGRSVRLEPTEKARALRKQDPMQALVEAADALPPGVRGAFLSVLRTLVADVAGKKARPLFGTCETCAHFTDDSCCRDAEPAFMCGFVDEPLRADELEELCINFALSDIAVSKGLGMGAA